MSVRVIYLTFFDRTLFGGQQEEQLSHVDASLQDDTIDVEDDPEIQAILANAISKAGSGSFSQDLDSFDAASPKSPEEDETPDTSVLKVRWFGEPAVDGRVKWNFLFKLVCPFYSGQSNGTYQLV